MMIPAALAAARTLEDNGVAATVSNTKGGIGYPAVVLNPSIPEGKPLVMYTVAAWLLS
jgi:hypothetical protein